MFKFMEVHVFLNLMAALVFLSTVHSMTPFGTRIAGNSKVMCIVKEKQALLDFKQGLLDYNDLLSSWGGENEDCCQWRGIQCDNLTRHVIKLDLRCVSDAPCFSGDICPSLLELQYLRHLDLSGGSFLEGMPSYIASLSKLEYLNLSWTIYPDHTVIPMQLSNLSRLRTLDLSCSNGLTSASLKWVSHVSSLRHLSLSNVDLRRAVDWLQSVAMLPSLSSLQLSGCELPFPKRLRFSHFNLSKSLRILDLSLNRFDISAIDLLFKFSHKLTHLNLADNSLKGPAPDFLINMTSLEYLDLSKNRLEGGISKPFGMLMSLKHLDLSSNLFGGGIPKSLGSLSSLEHLDLSNNLLIGGIPRSIGKLCSMRMLNLASNGLSGELSIALKNLGDWCHDTKLKTLQLSDNHFEGIVPELTTFSALRKLYLDGNNITGIAHNIMGVSSSLRVLHLGRNRLNLSIMESIRNLSNLTSLDISYNSLSGVITESHLRNFLNLKVLDISGNFLTVNFSPDWVPPFQLYELNMGMCRLGSSFPSWLQTQYNLLSLDLSQCEISDAIPDWFWNNFNNSAFLQYLNLSHNHLLGTLPDFSLSSSFSRITIDLSFNSLNGSVPPNFSNSLTSLILSNNLFSASISSLCMAPSGFMEHLDLSNNLFCGELPDCWSRWPSLWILNLANNNFTGKIPSSIGSLTSAMALHLRKNKFHGELPSSLRNCTDLEVLDLMDNNLSGDIPTWIGESLKSLLVLSLRSNKFNGDIPTTICDLQRIQILDLSLNHLSGNIPNCFDNLTSMSQRVSFNLNYSLPTWSIRSYDYNQYVDSQSVDMKGIEREYQNRFGLIKLIDLSSNKLTGVIPSEMTNLTYLISLNLSRNHLTGEILGNIGQLNSLDTLDLSRNRLSGEIPSGLSSLSHLGNLDLSFNNLSGQIPLGTQLQGFNSSVYEGNPGLCGSPISSCARNPSTATVTGNDGQDEHGKDADDKLLCLQFYIGAALGFILAFWGVFGTFLVKTSWRCAC